MAQASGIGRYDEVAVVLTPDGQAGALGHGRSGTVSGETSRAYTVLLYTDVGGPWDTPSFTAPPGQSSQIGRLPLVAVERLSVHWGRYRGLTRAASDVQQGAALRERLIQLASPALQALLAGKGSFTRPVRIWWHSDAPELVELPWELFAESVLGRADGRYHLVRGLPGDGLPLVPLEGSRLRLALIDAEGPTSELIRTAVRRIPNLDVVSLNGSLHEALSQAASERFELVHLIANGMVSLAYEGILAAYSSWAGRLTARDVSRLLRGSRVTVLGLTEMARTDVARAAVKRAAVESSEAVAPYRAFAHIGAAPEALPTVVAPLGFLDDDQLVHFWRELYRTLASTLSVEEAMRRARATRTGLPVALFLRHRLGQQFLRATTLAADRPEPTQLNADLQVSRGLAERLQAIDASFGGLADNVSGSELFARESSRQSRLAEELDAWTELREE